MKFMDKLKKGKTMAVLAAGTTACALMIFFAIYNYIRQQQPAPYTYYDSYSEAEQEIANRVTIYLPKYLSSIPDETAAQIADAAVRSYDVIMEADDVNIINDEHTEAIKKRISSEILTLIGDTANLTVDDLDGLSSGITEIIFSTILDGIGQSADATKGREQEYYYLVESIQQQVDELKEQKMKVTISADINNNSANVDSSSLLNAINGMSEEEIRTLAESMGINLEELKAGTNVKDGRDGKNGNDGEDGKDGKDGEDGKDGKDGKNGKDGEDGKDGKDGKNGKSAYEVAVENGYKGTEAEWLKGIDGENGKSAYEVAVENGFKGTEAEWLESLKGLDGNVAVEMWDADTQTLYLIPIGR